MRHYSLWLQQYKKRREELLTNLRSYKKLIEEITKQIPVDGLILPLDSDKKLEGKKFCFIDGGEGIRELLGAAIYIIRASGLIITKSGGNHSGEQFVRDLDINIIDYDEHTNERVGLLRGAMEFSVAMRCIIEHNPEYLFLDGSLYVNLNQNPIECIEYEIYKKKFIELLKLCKEKNVHLTGISEDSSSRLLISHLSAKYNLDFPKFITDSGILKLLSKRDTYKTVWFTPKSKSKETAIKFTTTYLQPTALSNPIRVDVPEWEQNGEGIINLIVDLCKGSRYYGYPLPMYLVHLDACLKPKQSEWSTNQLIHYVSKHDTELYDALLKDTRRGMRP